MPSQSFRVGVAAVQLAVSTSLAIGSMASTVVTCAAVTPTSFLNNDIRQSLPASTTWKVCIAPVGEDQVNGGYTVGVASAESSAITTTAGQGIKVHVDVSGTNSLASITNVASMCLVAIFLKQGAADYQLCDFAYVDPAKDFNYVITTKPLLTAPYFNYTLLSAATVDATLGSRVPYGYSFVSLAPTTGGVTVQRDVASVTISPDNSLDFQVATARSTTISFNLLANDVVDVVRAAGGTYVKYTDNSIVQENAQQSIATAQAKLIGNKPVKLVMPPDRSGFQEVRIYMGCLTSPQNQITESWSRDAATPIQYVFSTAIQDKLLIDQHVEIITKVNA